jgi:hypothetical protein
MLDTSVSAPKLIDPMSFFKFDDRRRRWNRPRFLTRQPVDHGGGMST